MRIPDMQDFFLPAMETGLMLAEAQVVIALRLAGLAGLWPVGEDEGVRMVAEKLEAGQASATAALWAGMGGATAGEVALAAIAPLRDRTRANARRLMGG